MNCLGCGRPTVSQNQWRALSVEERRALQARVRPNIGRGLCPACYMRARKAGTLEDFERATVPAALVVSEWQHADLPRDWSKAKRVRHLAPRLSMTPDALERALLRAGVAA